MQIPNEYENGKQLAEQLRKLAAELENVNQPLVMDVVIRKTDGDGGCCWQGKGIEDDHIEKSD